MIPSAEMNNMLWVDARCLLNLFFFFNPSLLGPQLEESSYILLLCTSLLKPYSSALNCINESGYAQSRLASRTGQKDGAPLHAAKQLKPDEVSWKVCF